MALENLVSDLEAKDWSHVCLDSIRKEKAEIAKQYNIRFGQIEIYCDRCECPIANPLKHTYSDLRLKALRERNRPKNALSGAEKDTYVEYGILKVRSWPRTHLREAIQGKKGYIEGYLSGERKYLELCQICGKEFPVNKLNQDHHHRSGQLRGLLCR